MMDHVLSCKRLASKVSGAGNASMIPGLKILRIRIETMIPQK